MTDITVTTTANCKVNGALVDIAKIRIIKDEAGLCCIYAMDDKNPGSAWDTSGGADSEKARWLLGQFDATTAAAIASTIGTVMR